MRTAQAAGWLGYTLEVAAWCGTAPSPGSRGSRGRRRVPVAVGRAESRRARFCDESVRRLCTYVIKRSTVLVTCSARAQGGLGVLLARRRRTDGVPLCHDRLRGIGVPIPEHNCIVMFTTILTRCRTRKIWNRWEGSGGTLIAFSALFIKGECSETSLLMRRYSNLP